MAESQQIGASPHPPIHQAVDDHPHSKRNYASKECGAKVLYSNEEAENKGAILNDPERDDYMRNPCRVQNKFLIIELCETIQVLIFFIFSITILFLANFTGYCKFWIILFEPKKFSDLGQWTISHTRMDVNWRIWVARQPRGTDISCEWPTRFILCQIYQGN